MGDHYSLFTCKVLLTCGIRLASNLILQLWLVNWLTDCLIWLSSWLADCLLWLSSWLTDRYDWLADYYLLPYLYGRQATSLTVTFWIWLGYMKWKNRNMWLLAQISILRPMVTVVGNASYIFVMIFHRFLLVSLSFRELSTEREYEIEN